MRTHGHAVWRCNTVSEQPINTAPSPVHIKCWVSVFADCRALASFFLPSVQLEGTQMVHLGVSPSPSEVPLPLSATNRSQEHRLTSWSLLHLQIRAG